MSTSARVASVIVTQVRACATSSTAPRRAYATCAVRVGAPQASWASTSSSVTRGSPAAPS
ncbi:MAG: hypothetical protein IPL61_23095 [Myxococcales bacterium]|nr:hypothetical protein [Myxococcales bacterium]